MDQHEAETNKLAEALTEEQGHWNNILTELDTALPGLTDRINGPQSALVKCDESFVDHDSLSNRAARCAQSMTPLCLDRGQHGRRWYPPKSPSATTEPGSAFVGYYCHVYAPRQV